MTKVSPVSSGFITNEKGSNVLVHPKKVSFYVSGMILNRLRKRAAYKQGEYVLMYGYVPQGDFTRLVVSGLNHFMKIIHKNFWGK